MAGGMIASSLAMYPSRWCIGQTSVVLPVWVQHGYDGRALGMLAVLLCGVIGAFNELRSSTQKLNEQMAKTAKSYSATNLKVDRALSSRSEESQ